MVKDISSPNSQIANSKIKTIFGGLMEDWLMSKKLIRYTSSKQTRTNQ